MDELNQAQMQLAVMSRGYVLSRAIHAVAALNLADHMSHEPIEVEHLAAATGTLCDRLDRLLSFLSVYGLFKKTENKYALLPLAYPLKSEDPHSIKDVLCMVDDSWWQAFSDLGSALKNESAPFQEVHGRPFFDFLSEHPEKQARFDKGMAKLSSYDDAAIAEAFDFGALNELVELGGGRGGLAKAILKKHPKLKITLFDTASVLKENLDLPAEIKIESGNFFKKIPKARAYLLKGVLHDFDDEAMQKILKNLRQEMQAGSHLLIAEQVIPEEEGPHPNKTMDIVMMVLLGGKQRTIQEWKKQVEPLGFKLQEQIPSKSIFTLLHFIA